MTRGSEYKIQSECVRFFRRTYPDYILYSVSNEAAWQRKSYFSALGLLDGVSDTVVLLPGGKSLYVEFKAPRGYQSNDQKVFQKKVEKLGFEYYVVKSVDEFKEIVKSALM